jgi:transcriptional antiterminator NusG
MYGNVERKMVCYSYLFRDMKTRLRQTIEKTIENRESARYTYLKCSSMEEQIEDQEWEGKRVVQRKIFPGYVLVKMIMTDESWYIVRNTRGVTGFVGPGSKPIPLTDDEVRMMGVEDIPIKLDARGRVIMCG